MARLLAMHSCCMQRRSFLVMPSFVGSCDSCELLASFEQAIFHLEHLVSLGGGEVRRSEEERQRGRKSRAEQAKTKGCSVKTLATCVASHAPAATERAWQTHHFSFPPLPTGQFLCSDSKRGREGGTKERGGLVGRAQWHRVTDAINIAG